MSDQIVLADTSVWVDHLRRGGNGAVAQLQELLAARSVIMCGPVLAELLAGTAERDRARLAGALRALPWSELDRGAWESVGIAAAQLRATGQTVALTDIEIAAAAIRAKAALWTRDADFRRIANVIDGLELFAPSG